MREDVFALLYEDVAHIPSHANVLLCGDYNAHTNTLPDYDIENRVGSDGNLVNLLPEDVLKSRDDLCKLYTTVRLIRYSKDTRPATTQGMSLIEFCNDTGLLIMNGRIGSDKGVGDFTRMGIGESSVVDYIIASPAMLDMLRDFQICAKLPESDHLPIMFSINCNYEWTHKSGSNVNWAPHVKYMWNANDLPNIQHALCDEISVPFHEQIQQALSDGVSTDHVANAVNALVGQACERACTTKSNAFVKHKYKGPGWYDMTEALSGS